MSSFLKTSVCVKSSIVIKHTQCGMLNFLQHYMVMSLMKMDKLHHFCAKCPKDYMTKIQKCPTFMKFIEVNELHLGIRHFLLLWRTTIFHPKYTKRPNMNQYLKGGFLVRSQRKLNLLIDMNQCLVIKLQRSLKVEYWNI